MSRAVFPPRSSSNANSAVGHGKRPSARIGHRSGQQLPDRRRTRFRNTHSPLPDMHPRQKRTHRRGRGLQERKLAGRARLRRANRQTTRGCCGPACPAAFVGMRAAPATTFMSSASLRRRMKTLARASRLGPHRRVDSHQGSEATAPRQAGPLSHDFRRVKWAAVVRRAGDTAWPAPSLRRPRRALPDTNRTQVCASRSPPADRP